MIAWVACCWISSFASSAPPAAPDGERPLDVETIVWDAGKLPYDPRHACGPFCLTFLAEYYGVGCELTDVIAACGPPGRSASLRQLRTAARELGLHAAAYSCPVEDLNRLSHPAILHLVTANDVGHFVVCVRYDDATAQYLIYDPQAGLVRSTEDQLRERYTGTLMVVSVQPLTCIDDAFSASPSPWPEWFLAGLLCSQVLYLARRFRVVAVRRRELSMT